MSLLILVGSFTPLLSTLNFTLSPPSLSLVSQVAAGSSPSWLLGHPVNTSIVYATDETQKGAIQSLVLDRVTGRVTPVSSISAQGSGTTHLGFVNGGADIGGANFNDGSAFFATLSDDLLHFNNPQLVKFGVGNATSHAHEIVSFGKDVLVPDLGQDQVFRLGLDNGQWAIRGSVQQNEGSGPRHIVIDGDSLYTLHEKSSTLTQQNVTTTVDDITSRLVASISIVPPGANTTVPLAGGELIFAENPVPLLYASNRDDPDPAGDAIAIFETVPRLVRVAEVRTGLKHLRGVAFIGDDNEFLIAGGLNGGGIKIFERVSADQGFLREIASLKEGVVDQPTSFIGVSPVQGGLSGSTSLPTAIFQDSTITGVLPVDTTSGAGRRFESGFFFLCFVSILSWAAFSVSL